VQSPISRRRLREQADACPIPELISALRQSFENGRQSISSVSASLGARPYLIGEGGTLDECIQQFMHLPEAQRHLYEIHTAPQSDLVSAILSTEHVVELARLRDFLGK
jgi:hypothetical protein